VTGDDGVPTIVIRRDGGDPLGDPAQAPSISAAAPVITPDAPPPPPSPALLRALEKMREVFRLRELRPGQAEIIESVLAGRDTLAVMPTGSGKSLTYQLPALVLETEKDSFPFRDGFDGAFAAGPEHGLAGAGFDEAGEF